MQRIFTRTLFAILVTLVSIPYTVFASTNSNGTLLGISKGVDLLSSLVGSITNNIGSSLVKLLISVAMIVFFYGIIEFILGQRGGDGAKTATGKKFIGWGLVALFVMFSVMGFIRFGQDIFFPKQNLDKITIPSFTFNSASKSGSTSPLTSSPGVTSPVGTAPDVNDSDDQATADPASGTVDATNDEGQKELAEIASDATKNVPVNENVPSSQQKYVYSITNNRIGDLIQNTTNIPEQRSTNETIWGMFVVSNPSDTVSKITTFEVFPYKTGEGTLGYVSRANQPDGMFSLGINIDEHSQSGRLDTSNLYDTLLHEGMHITTLSLSQLDPSFTNGSCTTYYTVMWNARPSCFREDSYLAEFMKAFWVADRYNVKFTSKFPSGNASFVNAYAATGPIEDIAETYIFFVTRDRPTGTRVVDQKINFFYQFPELVSQRTIARNGIKQEVYGRKNDYDGDGVSNVLEEKAGTDPTAIESDPPQDGTPCGGTTEEECTE